jgi:hypothetical protein
MFFYLQPLGPTTIILERCSLVATLRDLRGHNFRFEVLLLKSNGVLLFEMSTFFLLNK